MKLLIVEDEKMAREGLVKSLDWPKVGISKVLSAENGEAGLFIAKRVMPDIVLTDIRMPRMDGITMAGRMRELLPDCRIIFLSAYSEIDYYKAAIDLKAVRYLDKPIEAERLQEVILEAVAECTQLLRYKDTHELHHRQEKQKLADAICAGEDSAELEKEIKRLKLPLETKSAEAFVTALVISLRQQYEDETRENLVELAAALSEALSQPSLYTLRHKDRLVLFLFSPQSPTNYQLETAVKRLQEALRERVYSIAVGPPVRGIGNAHKSYGASKVALKKAYCFPWKEAAFYHEGLEKDASISEYGGLKDKLLSVLGENQEQKTLSACDELYHTVRERKDLVYNKARELYFEIISEVFRKAAALHLQIKEDGNGEAISWVVRMEDFNLDELNGFLKRQVSLLFAAIEDAKNEKKQILVIKDYIAQHYTNDALSISDISTFLHMSASHVCTMFKKETGDTINNYLTDYRLKKAKQYLSETLFSISEISAKVGYKDNSYFGRIFRKHVGMTPNEYRNR